MTQSEPTLESPLLDSWQANADLWATAIREGKIQSRKTTTDAAIEQAILAFAPHKALDLGCGEGWLIRAISQSEPNIHWVGVEGAPALAEKARADSGAEILTLSYAELVADPTRCGLDFDLIAANFSLLEGDLLPLLKTLRQIVSPKAHLLIQTLHPCFCEGPYLSGLRSEQFGAMGTGDWQAMPWYFRTLGEWISVLVAADLRLISLQEPLLPDTQRPASLLITAAFGDAS